jgi:hypothetical protein
MRGKPARPVLRGRGRSNASPLPDKASHNLARVSVSFDDDTLLPWTSPMWRERNRQDLWIAGIPRPARVISSGR